LTKSLFASSTLKGIDRLRLSGGRRENMLGSPVRQIKWIRGLLLFNAKKTRKEKDARSKKGA